MRKLIVADIVRKSQYCTVLLHFIVQYCRLYWLYWPDIRAGAEQSSWRGSSRPGTRGRRSTRRPTIRILSSDPQSAYLFIYQSIEHIKCKLASSVQYRKFHPLSLCAKISSLTIKPQSCSHHIPTLFCCWSCREERVTEIDGAFCSRWWMVKLCAVIILLYC